MERKHAIVLAMSFILVGMMFFHVHMPVAFEQYVNNRNIEPQQAGMQLSDRPVPQEPLHLNVIENPSFEDTDTSTLAPSGWVPYGTAYQHADDMYTGSIKMGNYGGLIESMGGKTSIANSYLRTEPTDSPTTLIKRGISLSFNWHIIQNFDLSLNATAYLFILTTNSTGSQRRMWYMLSHGTILLSNFTSWAQFSLNDTIGQWNDFDRNITEDYLAVFGSADLSDSHYIVSLWFYAASPSTTTNTLRYVIDNVKLYNTTYSGWLPNGDFEDGLGSDWTYYNTALAYVEQSTDSTHGTYSLNISQPKSSSDYGYGRLSIDFSVYGVYLGQEPGMTTISFDWKYNDTYGVGTGEFAYFRMHFQNTSDYYIHLYLGQNGDVITNSNTTNSYHIELPGFGTRNTWQHAEFDLYDLLSELGLLGTYLIDIRFEITQSYSNAGMEILVDDFKMITYPSADPGFEYDNIPGSVSPHLGWYAVGLTLDAVSKTTDDHSGTYANNMTCIDDEDAHVLRENLYAEIDSGLFTEFWWKLDDIRNTVSEYSASYIQLSFDASGTNRYIRYILANDDWWSPTNISITKYLYAYGFNQTGVWTRLYRNITDDVINAFSITPTDWVINGIEFWVSAGIGGRTSLIFDDINFIDAIPPTVDSITYDTTPIYNEDVLVRVSTTDTRPGVSSVSVIYTTDSWSSFEVGAGVWDQGDWYNATIPAQTYNTQVDFFIQVTDGCGVEKIDDNDGFYYSYTVYDDLAPELTISNPANNTDQEGLLTITAIATDSGSGIEFVTFNPDGTGPINDDTAPYSQNWNLDDTSLGSHIIIVTARDHEGNTVTKTHYINVVDTVDPVLDSPSDIKFTVGEPGNMIDWDPTDIRPATYEMFVGSVSTYSGDWNASSEHIIIGLDGLAVGIYNYTCVVYDEAGNSAADTVIVTVNEVATTPMIEWINLGVLLLSGILYLIFYVKSAGPAQLEQKIGESAYSKCARYRVIAGVFSFVAVANYIVYYFYPLPIGLPRFFPWDWWISIVIGIIILVPSVYLMYIGTRDAGEEAMVPKKEHTLYGGIYETIRHPQAIGEFFLWFSIALWLNSPFLVLYSLLWIPIYYLMCLAEEKDLVIRYGQSYIEYRDRVGFLIPKRKR